MMLPKLANIFLGRTDQFVFAQIYVWDNNDSVWGATIDVIVQSPPPSTRTELAAFAVAALRGSEANVTPVFDSRDRALLKATQCKSLSSLQRQGAFCGIRIRGGRLTIQPERPRRGGFGFEGDPIELPADSSLEVIGDSIDRALAGQTT